MPIVNRFTRSWGWTKDGDIMTDDGNRLSQVKDDNMLLNLIMFHLLTAPGEYTPAPYIGAGLKELAGLSNTEENRILIEDHINDYFNSINDFTPNIVQAKAALSDRYEIEVELHVAGPYLNNQEVMLITLAKSGLKLDSMAFVTPTVPEEGFQKTEAVNNPYLLRMS
jgi:hypothetical protein